jgi:hypothetical protein
MGRARARFAFKNSKLRQIALPPTTRFVTRERRAAAEEQVVT